jgi:crotonobetainyl-CoA:carnitine CoA-transferase CaiB-like acyl-CoA transferase
MRPLEGLRVIDLSSGPAGGLATMVLADFGADVIKVERPGGDPFRRIAAAPMWLRGKRSLVLNLREASELERLYQLTDGADVVVVSFRPGSAAHLGADHETLAARNPALIYASITGWGPRGPYARYPGYEGVVAAKSGRMAAFTGQRPREGPAYAAVPVGVHAASQGAVQGILAALIARDRTGLGQKVETSLLQAMQQYDLMELLAVQLAERDPGRLAGLGRILGPMPTLNYHPVMAKDGRWIQLGNLLEHLFYAFLDSADLLDELLAEERFQSSPATWKDEVLEEARDRILERMRERTAEEWMRIFRANGNIPAEPYASAQEALENADLVANGEIVEHMHPKLGVVRQIGPIAQLTETPGLAGEAGPTTGQHQEEILVEAPRTPATPEASGDPLPRGRPLHGVTILDFATIIAAPLATSLLADLGARVVKVEPPGGDPYRALGPAGLLAVKTNAGKESICVDLKSDEGQRILSGLIRKADAIVHNLRPGVPERLGIGYEQVRALRPDIVWVAVGGYGPYGPSANRPSAHPVPGAAVGGALYQAGAGMPPPNCESLAEIREVARQLMRANEPNPDPNTSMLAVSATLLGLWARRRLGRGQCVFVNMLAANAYANADDFLSYPSKPPRPPVDSDLHGLRAGYRLYRARDGWVFLALVTDAEWSAFCAATHRPDLTENARFTTAEAREKNDAALTKVLAALFRERSADAWEALLTPIDVGCVRADAARPGEFFARDEHVLENGFAPRARHARLGELRRWGPLVVCDGGHEAYGPGALAGEHTDALLAELGRSREEIARLRGEGVVGSEPAD